MKKALFLLPGVVAVMFAAAPIISGHNSTALADQARTGGWHGHDALEKLNLTDSQKTQIKQIRESAKQQMDAVLTSDQKTQQQQARLQHTRPKLNLSDDQKAQLKQIRQSTESQINAVLTPQQQQQLQQLRSQKHQQHSEHSS